VLIQNVTVINLHAFGLLETSQRTEITVHRPEKTPNPIEGWFYELRITNISTDVFNVPYTLVFHGNKDEITLFLTELQETFLQALSGS